MAFDRRQVLTWLSAGLAGSAAISCASAEPKRQSLEERQVRFPPFELQASPSTLRELGQGLSGWSVHPSETSVHALWLRSGSGKVFLVTVDQRLLQHMFEVFTLGIRSLDEVRKQLDGWQPPALPADVPENFRKLFSTRPSMPTPPTTFEPWPFASGRIEVLRRAEFIVEDAAPGPTFGDNPNAQSAARPGQVPVEASVSCEVATGLMFSERDRCLLIGVDWMPMNILVTEDAAEIGQYAEVCEVVSLDTYLDRYAT